MSYVFNMIYGSTGGGSETYAFIIVTYPAGAACTASDGTTTLTAPDTSGSWVCKVPNAGTWVITATDNGQTASVSVSISTEGQRESVVLDFIIYLFRDGVYVGTWEAKPWSTSGATLTKRAPSVSAAATLSITMPSSSSEDVGIAPNNTALDLTRNTIEYAWNNSTIAGSYSIVPAVFQPYSDGFSIVKRGTNITTGSGTGSINISDLSSGSYYFGIWLYKGLSSTVNLKFTEVKLL